MEFGMKLVLIIVRSGNAREHVDREHYLKSS